MKIRKFSEKDSIKVAKLAMRTFKKYNGLDFFDKEAITGALDFFDPDKNTKEELIEKFRKSYIFYVAEEGNSIIGMIRGISDRISSLFVDENWHKNGIGKKLIEHFEVEARKNKSTYIKIRSSLYAVNFYQKVGYKKTTGMRNHMGLKIYNMKKKLV
jgi:GNAT superfamily N-acetyltransferase